MTLPRPDDALDTLTAVRADSPGTVVATFPDQWQQGRGAFGGLVVATLVRALQASAPDRPLRSLTAELCGPVEPGEARLRVELLRQGNAATTSAVRLEQGGEVRAHGVGVLGRLRTSERDGVELAPPTPPPWREVEALPIEPPLGPAFARFFEFRPTGPLPFSGNPAPITEGWIRPKHPGALRDEAYLAACVDAYWPSLYNREPVPRPMATIAYTLQPFAHFEGLSPDAPLFYRARLQASTAGYAVEHRELWGEDGRLLALNVQTIAIVK